uniref:Putative ovule protein n=1 Tax=Solanum chacoense TaxID=4108 RepID=A0A0V0H3K3_SOLCH
MLPSRCTTSDACRPWLMLPAVRTGHYTFNNPFLKRDITSVMVVGMPPTKIFLVLKSFESADPFGMVLLISTCLSLIIWFSAITVSTTVGSAKVMNPKPLGLPVCLSFIITESIISPYFSKYFTNCSRVVSFARPPIKIFPGLAPSPKSFFLEPMEEIGNCRMVRSEKKCKT